MVQTILARTALEIARDSLYFYEPEDEDDTVHARLMQPQVISNTADNLLSNVPNPYKDETVIYAYVSENAVNAKLVIFDMYGHKVLEKALKTGANDVLFSSDYLSTGIYYYTMYNNAALIVTKKMCIIK